MNFAQALDAASRLNSHPLMKAFFPPHAEQAKQNELYEQQKRTTDYQVDLYRSWLRLNSFALRKAVVDEYDKLRDIQMKRVLREAEATNAEPIPLGRTETEVLTLPPHLQIQPLQVKRAKTHAEDAEKDEPNFLIRLSKLSDKLAKESDPKERAATCAEMKAVMGEAQHKSIAQDLVKAVNDAKEMIKEYKEKAEDSKKDEDEDEDEEEETETPPRPKPHPPPSPYSSTGRTISFGDRMNKSYRVTLGRGMRYKSERSPHVETDQDVAKGTTFKLGARTQKVTLKGTAVMYEVVGLKNGSFPAHITTYFGPHEEAHAY
jgi:hypothetical protein